MRGQNWNQHDDDVPQRQEDSMALASSNQLLMKWKSHFLNATQAHSHIPLIPRLHVWDCVSQTSAHFSSRVSQSYAVFNSQTFNSVEPLSVMISTSFFCCFFKNKDPPPQFVSQQLLNERKKKKIHKLPDEGGLSCQMLLRCWIVEVV